MINKRVKTQDSSNKDEVEKEVAYLAKNVRKFSKFKKDGKFFEKGKFSNFKKDKKDFKKKNSQISRRTRKTSRRKTPKTHLHLKQLLAMSAKGMGM